MQIKVENGPVFPVDDRFHPVNGFDAEGNPQPLTIEAGGGLKVSGGSTAGDASLASLDANVGAKDDAAATGDSGTFSLIALVKRLLSSFTTLINRSFGLAGSTYIPGTGEVAGTFCAIQALEDTVVATMTSSDISGTLEDVPIPAGVTIYGTATSITLTSGKVIAYHK